MLHAAKHLFGDFLTAIVFVAAYAATDSLPLAVAATVAAAALQIGTALVRKQRLDAMVWLGLFLALAFGAAALVSQNPRFVMAKPSIIHGAIAVAMLRRGWMMRYLPDVARARIPEGTIVAVGYAWAVFMVGLALLNLLVAATASFTTWALFVSVGLLGAKLCGFLVTYGVFRLAAARSVGARPSMPIARSHGA